MAYSFTIKKYLDSAKGQTLPPFILEVILKSGRSFYLKSVIDIPGADPETDLMPLRVWDLRALTNNDLGNMMTKLNEIRDRDHFEIRDLHPDIGQANLWIRLAEIEAIVEWHDRFWPEPSQSPLRQPKIGFQRDEENAQ